MRFDRLLALYRRHFREPRRERLFLASVSFFLAFIVTRLTTHAQRAGTIGFRGIWLGETHVHHLVVGILVLLLAGYGGLIQPPQPGGHPQSPLGRAVALLYGIGAALTLDEFALWVNLEDVYWERRGRISIDAVLLFGALISIGLWGGPFFRAVGRHAGRLFRSR
jgi:hypothetical protein